MSLLSIIVPCYNEEETVLLFHEAVCKELTNIPVDYEIVMVNDGSSDNTLSLLKQLSAHDDHCIYVSFSRNFGKEAAMYAGLESCHGDYAVIMDADLQHPPHLLKDMYHAIQEEGYDCAGGLRISRIHDSKFRSFVSHNFYQVINSMSEVEMKEGEGDFRMMKRCMIDAILSMKEYNRYSKGLFSFVGFKTKWIPFEDEERAAGKSKWSLKSLFSYAMEGILSFSEAPVHMAMVLGITLCMTSLLFFIFLLFHHTFTLLILTIILLLSGIQLIFIGIVGKYVTKDYIENKQRPLYIVKESNVPFTIKQ